MLARTHPAFHGPVILLQDVVKVLHRSMSAVLLQSALGFELHDGRRVSCVLVGVDDPRCRMVLTAQGFGQKRSAAAPPHLAERRKSIVAPLESTARYRYTHFPLTLT